MGHRHDGLPLVPQAPQDAQEPAGVGGVEPGGGLVEHQHKAP